MLSYAKKGLFGAVILGLGRALGETMAVTMVIGNTPQIVASLFKPADTLAATIANQFNEATGQMYTSALFEIGFVLLGVTVLVNMGEVASLNSLAMMLASVAPGLNIDATICGMLPITIVTAIVSPSARPKPRMIAPKSPFFA